MKIGVELEFSGLVFPEACEVVCKAFSKYFDIQRKDFSNSFSYFFYTGTQLLERVKEIPLCEINIEGIGNILIKPETNSPGIAEVATSSICNLTEIVFPPLEDMNLFATMESIFKEIERGGAIGTQHDSPVSTQINLDVSTCSLLEIRDILVRYRNSRKIPAPYRRNFVNDFHPCFIDFLHSMDTRTTVEDMFECYFVTQLKERMKDAHVYMDVEEYYASFFSKLPHSFAAHIVKYVFLKPSSYLLYRLPDNPISKIIETYQWVWPIPALEFRDFDTDFGLLDKLNIVRGVL